MSIYDDGKVKINDKSIRISGVIVPKISQIEFNAEDIERIDVVKLNFLDRFRIQGTMDLKTWWCFDIKRPKYKQGFKIFFKDKVGPFQAIGFTAEDTAKAKRILRENFDSVFTG